MTSTSRNSPPMYLSHMDAIKGLLCLQDIALLYVRNTHEKTILQKTRSVSLYPTIRAICGLALQKQASSISSANGILLFPQSSSQFFARPASCKIQTRVNQEQSIRLFNKGDMIF